MIKTAVVTGFSGFLGTTFTMQLLNKGWKVYGIDKLTHVSNKKLIKQTPENFNFGNNDIRNIEWLPECDVIFNFAAESDVDIGNQSCDKFIKSNIDALALPVLKDDSSLENTSMALSILRLYDFSSNIYSPILIL